LGGPREELRRPLGDPLLLRERRKREGEAVEKAREVQVAQVGGLGLEGVEPARHVALGERELDIGGAHPRVEPDLATEVRADQRDLRGSGTGEGRLVDPHRSPHRLVDAAARDLDHQVADPEPPPFEARPAEPAQSRRPPLRALPVAELGAAEDPHPHAVGIALRRVRLAPFAPEDVEGEIGERGLGPSCGEIAFGGVAGIGKIGDL
jgi:hypothetical protein